MPNLFDDIKIYPDFTTEDDLMEVDSYERLLTDVPQCVETLVAASAMYCSRAEKYEILSAIAHRMNCMMMVMDE